MPADITDVDEFTDPVTEPVDGDDADAASVDAPFQALANRARWLYNRIGGVLYPVSRVMMISPPTASPFEFGGTGVPAFNAFGTGWSQIVVSQKLFIPIQLPVGCKITQVDALIKGAGGGSHADDTTLKLFKSDRTAWAANNVWSGAGGGPVTPAQVGSTATVASSAIAGIGVTPGGSGETVTAGFVYYAEIVGDSGNATEVTFFGLRVTFTDPGPRNA